MNRFANSVYPFVFTLGGLLTLGPTSCMLGQVDIVPEPSDDRVALAPSATVSPASLPPDPGQEELQKSATTATEVAIGKKTVPGRTAPSPDEEEEEFLEDYVSGFLAYTCGNDIDTVFLPRKHETPGCQESIRLDAFMVTDDGDTYEVGAYVYWMPNDPSWVSVGWSPHEIGPELVHARGSKDLFDTSKGEPETDIVGCAMNQCSPKQKICDTMVCATLHVVGVVNVESAEWCYKEAPYNDPCTHVTMRQDGRGVVITSDGQVNADNAIVTQSSLSWSDGDYAYLGTIKPSRTSITGVIWNQLGDEKAGEFRLTR